MWHADAISSAISRERASRATINSGGQRNKFSSARRQRRPMIFVEIAERATVLVEKVEIEPVGASASAGSANRTCGSPLCEERSAHRKMRGAMRGELSLRGDGLCGL